MKQAFNVIKNVLAWLFVAFAVFMMIFTFVSVKMFNNANASLFGYRSFIVLSDSMSATDFDAGDVVLVKSIDPDTLQPGDIISFYSQDPDIYGEVVTHKIRERTTDPKGAPAFITYGTTTDSNDRHIVTYEHIIGKYQMALPRVGTFFDYMKTTQGYVTVILIPFLLLILFNAFNCIQLFQQYRREQLEELQFEKEKIAQERAESQRVLQELMELKANMGLNTPPSDATSPPIPQ